MEAPRLQREKGSAAASASRVWSPANFRPLAASPRRGLSDEAIWKRLKEGGFDEEMIKKRDKAALVAYIAKLEAEIYDYQHNMGLLLLEKKDLLSKCEQIKASTELAELAYKREQAALSSALAECRKREDNLKKSLAIEKECISSLEKTMHSIRTESAEAKVAAENKLAEAYVIIENAQKKIEEAHNKSREAESLRAEASRYERTSSTKLQEVEAREDDLRRRFVLFNSQCDAKEKSISLERQSVHESRKLLQQQQEKLLDRQSCLDQREEHILGRLGEFHQFEQQLEKDRGSLEEERSFLKEEKSKLALDIKALAMREESIIDREVLLDKKEKELLVSQEQLSAKEHNDIQRLKVEIQQALDKRKCDFEAEMEELRRMVNDELEIKRQTCEQTENDLQQRINDTSEKEKTLYMQSLALAEKNVDLAKKLKHVEEKEQFLSATEKAAEEKISEMQKQKQEIENMRLTMEKTKESLEAEKNEVQLMKDKLEITVVERNDLFIMEKRLKEEIDSFRAQQAALAEEAGRLREEKEKFEHEWEFIDEKKAELFREAERISGERESVSQYLKNEQESMKIEKDNLHYQFKADLEALSREREEFMKEMEQEHSTWLSKIQKEREDIVEDMKLQKRALESSIKKRRDEIEAYLREREWMLEQEKIGELHCINSQKEKVAMDLKNVALEIKKIDDEKREIALDRLQREKEWIEIRNSIEELNVQREKLQRQRELLQADRKEIYTQIQRLNSLERLSINMEHQSLHDNADKFPVERVTSVPEEAHRTAADHKEYKISANDTIKDDMLLHNAMNFSSPPMLKKFSWVKRCAQIILGHSPEKLIDASSRKDAEKSFIVQHEAIAKSMEAEVNGKDRILSNRKGVQPIEVSKCCDEGLHSLPLRRKSAKRSSSNIDLDVHLDSSLDRQKKEKRHRLVDEVINGDVTLTSDPGTAISEPCSKEVHENLVNFKEGDATDPAKRGAKDLLADPLLPQCDAIDNEGSCRNGVSSSNCSKSLESVENISSRSEEPSG